MLLKEEKITKKRCSGKSERMKWGDMGGGVDRKGMNEEVN